MYNFGCLFPGASARRWLLKLLPVLALILICTTTWAAGQKVGQVSVTGQNPNPVNPGKSAAFLLTLTRDNHNGSTGSFVANLTYSPITPGVTYDPATPTSISYTPKESSKGFFFTVRVASTVAPGDYPFMVTAARTGATKDTQSTIAHLIVGFSQVGPIAVDDSGYFTSGLAINIPVLANDIPDPNVANKSLLITAIQGMPVIGGGTVALTNASVTLNANGTLTYTPSANLAPGADQFTYTITDPFGHSSTALVTVTVGQFPRVTLNSELVVTCGSSYMLTATGAGGFPPYIYTWTDSSNNVLRTSVATNGTDSLTVTAAGTYAVTVMDSTGNISAPDQSIVSFSTAGPMIVCPSNIVQAADPGLCSAAINPGTATAADNCSSVIVSGSRSDGKSLTNLYPVGVTTITWTALDGNGGMATCQQTVTVKDMEAPSITCPADVTVGTDKGQCTASSVVLGTPTTSDNCGGAVGLSNDAPTAFPKGTTTVTWTALDAAGNKATCTQKVTVNDTEVPTITCPPDVTVSTDTGQCTASKVTLGTPTTSDNCGVASVTNDAPTTFPKGTTNVTWTVMDTSGNKATCTQKVTVNDMEAPSITGPADITVCSPLGQSTAVVMYPDATVKDNCPGVSFTGYDIPSGGAFPQGATMVTGKAMDAAGNMATCHFMVTVLSNLAVTITPSDPCTPLMTLTASSGASYAWTGPDGNPAGSTQSISATTAGIYTVVVTNATGCQGSASITLEAVLRVKP